MIREALQIGEIAPGTSFDRRLALPLGCRSNQPADRAGGKEADMTTLPPHPPRTAGAGAMQPHRGALLLTFGILGLVICVIFGIVSWVMANADLRAMAEGRMDPSGEGLTKAGKILGIVSVALAGLTVVLIILFTALGVFAAAASQGGGGP
jgi:H+/gluconate symporter-like permease